jgi:Helix-turn-helix domain
MAKHRPKWHRIKSHRSYTVDEAARMLGVCKESVRRWRKAGLPFLDDQKPVLIMGQDLKAFSKSRVKPKQKCKLHECYCFRCKAPREPAGGLADFVPLTATNGNFKAMCAVCLSMMCKRASKESLTALMEILDVTVRQAVERLGDSAKPCANVDLKRGDDR